MEGTDLILFIGTSALFASVTVALWNGIPDRWLCDYKEEISRVHVERKIDFLPWALFFFTLFFLWSAKAYEGQSKIMLLLTLFMLQMLLLIFMADLKFFIIPDQFLAALVVLGIAGLLIQQIRLHQIQEYSLKPIFWYCWSAVMRLGEGIACALFFLVLGKAAVCVCFSRIESVEAKLKREKNLKGNHQKEDQKEGYGFGDVKFLATLGIVFGLKEGLSVLFFASLLCGLCLTVLLIFQRVSLDEEQAFGPYLCLAAGYYLLHYGV